MAGAGEGEKGNGVSTDGIAAREQECRLLAVPGSRPGGQRPTYRKGADRFNAGVKAYFMQRWVLMMLSVDKLVALSERRSFF